MAKSSNDSKVKRVQKKSHFPSPSHAKIKEAFPQTLSECLGIVTAACKKAGIHHETYYNWRRADPEWAAKCDMAYEKAGDFVESKLYELIKDKNPSAIIFYCKTKLRNRGYIERRENAVEITSHESRLKELE